VIELLAVICFYRNERRFSTAPLGISGTDKR
jgi:hypothetical protein